MDDLDDITHAVIDNNGKIVGFFGNKDDAESFLDVVDTDDCDGYMVAERDDDFYIDLRADISSSFDVRV